MAAIVAQFTAFVNDLATVEKRSIVALTEIARDALRTNASIAPSLATVVVNRILQAPPQMKLPAFYLLDSITKNIGEPYKSYFAPSLPDAYYNAWTIGGPPLYKSLEKLLLTWNGVFPPATLTACRARLPPSSAPAAASIAPTPMYSVAAQQQAAPVHKPMVPDPRLAAQVAAPLIPPVVAPTHDQYGYAQQYSAAYTAPPPVAAPVPQPAPRTTTTTTAARSTRHTAAPVVVQTPQSVELTVEKLKKLDAPSAISRLLAITEQTKSSFLDRKFLRRQIKATGTRLSRLWYIDLDTWMSTATAGSGSSKPVTEQTAQQQQAIDLSFEPSSCPVDDEQTHCALSGERFEQYWDEDHQEWRYKDAKQLDEEEAARYGLQEGAIVLVSALGGGGGGIAAVKQEDRGVKRDIQDDDDDQKADVKRVKTEG